VLTWLYNGTGGSILACAIWHGLENLETGTAADTRTIQAVVVGSGVTMSGVFSGVGRIVERPNRPGDSAKGSRDDLVFPAGTLHIVNVDRGQAAL
jgi:hypothetical protein